MRNTLKTGDSVWVRGGFGTEPRTLAVVEQPNYNDKYTIY